MKIFISYSSMDKTFAGRLALDLLAAGFPVWLDIWEMELGDSLYQKIFSGLDNSSYVIVVVSKNYNRSVWTSKEFRATLTKEDSTQRKILIPVVIDDAEVPLEIRDRIYSNFIDDYDHKIMQLKRFFSVNNISIKATPLNQRLIPIVFHDYLHLDKQILINILEDRDKKEKISQKQLWIKDLPSIDSLTIKIKHFIEKDASIDMQLKVQLQTDLTQIERLVRFMHQGTEIILNTYSEYSDIQLTSISLYWYYRYLLGNLYIILFRYTDLKQQFNVDLDREALVYNPFFSNTSFCRFYGVTETRSLVVFDPKNDDHYTFFVDSESSASKEFDEIPFPGPLLSFWDMDLIYKYMIPQNVSGHLKNPMYLKIMADFPKYQLGVS
jgi:hypothetical protein